MGSRLSFFDERDAEELKCFDEDGESKKGDFRAVNTDGICNEQTELQA